MNLKNLEMKTFRDVIQPKALILEVLKSIDEDLFDTIWQINRSAENCLVWHLKDHCLEMVTEYEFRKQN